MVELRWTGEMDAVLRSIYPAGGAHGVAAALGGVANARQVTSRAAKLGVRRASASRVVVGDDAMIGKARRAFVRGGESALRDMLHGYGEARIAAIVRRLIAELRETSGSASRDGMPRCASVFSWADQCAADMMREVA